MAAALLAGYAGGIAMGKMAPAVPLLQREFGLSLVQSGWLIATFNAMAASGGLLFGVMADRIGAYRCCLGAVGRRKADTAFYVPSVPLRCGMGGVTWNMADAA